MPHLRYPAIVAIVAWVAIVAMVAIAWVAIVATDGCPEWDGHVQDPMQSVPVR